LYFKQWYVATITHTVDDRVAEARGHPDGKEDEQEDVTFLTTRRKKES